MAVAKKKLYLIPLAQKMNKKKKFLPVFILRSSTIPMLGKKSEERGVRNFFNNSMHNPSHFSCFRKTYRKVGFKKMAELNNLQIAYVTHS